MRIASKEYIISTVYRTNILPIISECNTSCMFCSHKQNPRGVEVFRLGKLNLAEFEEIIEFLSPEKKIVVGESATRIIEGEPLLHKDFIGVLSLVRNKFKDTHIQITTNGMLLDQNMIDKFVELGNIELNVSVNCIDPLKRKQILGSKIESNIKEKLLYLKDRICFSTSAVVVPSVLEASDIEELVSFSDYVGADVIRLFMAGFTEKSPMSFDYEEAYNEMVSVIKNLKTKYNIPIILEPSIVKDLECRIEGVIPGSTSHNSGIIEGDVITRVNGSSVKTRVEAFDKIFKLKNPMVQIRRDNSIVEISLHKRKNTSPGFIMVYDIDPQITLGISRLATSYSAKKVLFITSELAFDVFDNLLSISNLPFNYDVLVVKNTFFGGSIKCAGLLTVDDVIGAVREKMIDEKEYDLIILPPIMFDNAGRDILGKNIKEAQEELKVSVDTI